MWAILWHQFMHDFHSSFCCHTSNILIDPSQNPRHQVREHIIWSSLMVLPGVNLGFGLVVSNHHHRHQFLSFYHHLWPRICSWKSSQNCNLFISWLYCMTAIYTPIRCFVTEDNEQILHWIQCTMSHLLEFTRKQLQTLQKCAVIVLVVHIVSEGGLAQFQKITSASIKLKACWTQWLKYLNCVDLHWQWRIKRF